MYCIPRSIPACAGEPSRRGGWTARSWVYPRVCGGTLSGIGFGLAQMGLSPRVRGNRDHPEPHRVSARSIPACAGEPIEPVRIRIPGKVYPRVCGGTVAVGTGAGTNYGLSPRVRGNRQLGSPRQRDDGSIPACAGEPLEIVRMVVL